jgi:hypothetical protein
MASRARSVERLMSTLVGMGELPIPQRLEGAALIDLTRP